MREGAKKLFARKLRREMTDAERCLWTHLRRHQLAGFRFRRQFPVGPYIVDFVCVEAKLVIEIDGSQHLESASDAVRSSWLEGQGFRVLRFWNHDVLMRTKEVLAVIFDALAPDGPHPNPPQPSPASGGGRQARNMDGAVTTLRFALAQFAFPVGAVAANASRMRELAAEARQRGASLIAFPEQSLCGYPAEDLLLRPGFLAACESELASLASGIENIAAVVGHPHAIGEVYNAASVIADREIRATYHKQALPNYTVFDEKRYFRPGSEPLVFDCEGVRVGLIICEDIWEAEPAAKAAANGAQLLLVINASPYDTRQAATREALLAQRATENDLPIAYVNVIGGQDDLLFDGASLLVAANGEVVARAPSFEEHLLFVEFDAAARTLRALDWPARQAESEEAILYAGLVRGVRDYVHKNGFKDVLLGLSGGIDSALTLSVAVDALGAEHVAAVMLPSRYTSELSLREAHAQAHALGVRYLDLPIEAACDAFTATLTVAAPGGLCDLAAQNLQSRSRGVLLMALSNQTGALLLTTGNKSEMAVGYATLYGDMCGAYAPLKDVYKTQVYRLARWRNRAGLGTRDSGLDPGKSEVIPSAVIDRPPSAELRADQTDQDLLPPYDILDGILARYIEGAQSQAEIIAAGFDSDTVHRVVRMVLINEFKRRQAAPGPRVSTCAFGRERRYPISSGWR